MEYKAWCLEIESALALNRGDIQRVDFLADNTIKIITQKVLSIAQQNTLAGLFPLASEIVVDSA